MNRASWLSVCRSLDSLVQAAKDEILKDTTDPDKVFQAALFAKAMEVAAFRISNDLATEYHIPAEPTQENQ